MMMMMDAGFFDPFGKNNELALFEPTFTFERGTINCHLNRETKPTKKYLVIIIILILYLKSYDFCPRVKILDKCVIAFFGDYGCWVF